MSNTHKVEKKLARAWTPDAWQDVTVLLAVSGGSDSVAMLRAMLANKQGGLGRLRCAHFNHHLRARQADEDEQFVVDLCRRLEVPCKVGHGRIRSDAAETGEGIEAAARRARYGFLRKTAGKVGARYVVTAHTADDQVETILHRIVRGTGIAGLSGMARVRPLGEAATLIRPMLGIHRHELIEYLDNLQQDYRRDPSNDDTRFTRNRIRHRLLPELAEQFNPGAADALLRLGRLAGEVQELVDQVVGDLRRRCLIGEAADTVRIDTTVLAGQPRYVIRELLIATWRGRGWPMQAMGFTQWELLAEMAMAAGSRSNTGPHKQVFPGNILAEITEDGRLLLVSQTPPSDE